MRKDNIIFEKDDLLFLLCKKKVIMKCKLCGSKNIDIRDEDLLESYICLDCGYILYEVDRE